MNRAVIILGSNIKKEKNLPAAVALLRAMCSVVAVSPVYETLPVGPDAGPTFFNAAVVVQTPLQPAVLKREVLARIEKALKRVRTGDKNAPRTIDLDLVLFNDEILDYEGRHVPDPELVRFAHMAVPVADVVPDLIHPEARESMRAIANRLLAEKGTAQAGEPLLRKRCDVTL
jgi:2-amino-4-hydroxy-6-hydroxymethyldihydropteridine diphosphokinase